MITLTRIIFLASIAVFSLATFSSAGIGLRLPISIPFLTFQKPHPHHHQHQHPHHQKHYEHVHTPDPKHHYHNDAHLDQSGRYYLHDPDSTVKFYYKEYLNGPSNRVDVHHDGCREVPMDYWYNRPKSLWAKHCVTLYQNGHCKGEGVQVAGMVSELRSIGMHYGVNSFKPCEKNIRIRFMPPVNHNHHHHHHHHHHNLKDHVNEDATRIQQIQLR